MGLIPGIHILYYISYLLERERERLSLSIVKCDLVLVLFKSEVINEINLFCALEDVITDIDDNYFYFEKKEKNNIRILE